jgi:hypothetical protein
MRTIRTIDRPTRTDRPTDRPGWLRGPSHCPLRDCGVAATPTGRCERSGRSRPHLIGLGRPHRRAQRRRPSALRLTRQCVTPDAGWSAAAGQGEGRSATGPREASTRGRLGAPGASLDHGSRWEAGAFPSGDSPGRSPASWWRHRQNRLDRTWVRDVARGARPGEWINRWRTWVPMSSGWDATDPQTECCRPTRSRRSRAAPAVARAVAG